MKPKTLVLMVVAVTCGLGASYMTSRLLADRQGEEVEKVAVLVAKKQIDTASPIKVPEDLFEEKLFTKGEEPRDAIAKFEELKGRILKRTLRPGDFIRLDDMLDSRDPQVAFSYHLPEGFRAVGQRVNIEATAGGFASLPLSRVDVVQTVRRGDDKTTYAKIILENVLVLAADQKTTRDESGNAMPAGTVTFALSPEDALKLALAREVGSLSLMLRKFNDNKPAPIDTVTAEDVKRGRILGKEESAELEAEAAGQAVAGLNLPPLKIEDAKPAVEVKAEQPPPQPVTRKHRMVIIEGDKSRPIDFVIDPQTLQVVHHEVTRTELVPQPPQIVPQPAPAAAPVPTPAPERAPEPGQE